VDDAHRPGDVADPRVVAAMEAVPRRRFVPDEVVDRAGDDRALPIGHGQTISQPYVVGVMTSALRIEPGDRVLEIGTGSGYQAAVLAELGARVFTIEIIPELAERARAVLADLGYDDVEVRVGDGHGGWAEQAPFDGIVVTAAPDDLPETLVDQLAPGGRLVVPIGPEGGVQTLWLLTRGEDGDLVRHDLGAVRFVPLTRDG
jgi:protein-L-isoaspartate(D-aspartate) O-methyltransferase